MNLSSSLQRVIGSRKQTGRRALCAIVGAIGLLMVAGLASQKADAQRRNTPKSPTEERGDFRPPSVPLVTHSPYFSVWSNANSLTDDFTRHWTGAIQPIEGLIRIDDKPYRWAGPEPKAVPALSFTGLEIYPTRSIYHMEGGGVRLNITFLSPLLPANLEIASRPVTYVTWSAESIDGKNHPVTLYFDCTGEWAVNTPDQTVNETTSVQNGLLVGKIGTEEQKFLTKAGDNLRIDYGYFYVAVPGNQGSPKQTILPADASRVMFSEIGRPNLQPMTFPRPARDGWPAITNTISFGTVGKNPISRHILLAYDELYEVQLLGKNLLPYWKRNGMTAEQLLATAEQQYKSVEALCRAFDTEIMADLAKQGGERYQRLVALAYRECWAAHGLAADAQGNPLLFPKENFSNGCISTVDILYPSSPFFLLFNTNLLRAQLTPVMDYANSGRWKFPFAPHDLGTYPLANGQVYGGGERDERDQMPVEESGNMILIVAAMAKSDGNADYATKYWLLLTRWAAYLRDKGLDPENQLCTDDFAGHLAHNTNLSLKAIEALGAYAMLCNMTGHKADGDTYRKTAQDYAARWQEMAKAGDHFKLTFDGAPETWSQKYNLVWDRLLGLNLFPTNVANSEISFYKTKQNKYGLPLDNRKEYTKLDWTVWTATLATTPEDFRALVAPLYDFVSATSRRVPLTDWFNTPDANYVGFQARSVVGGLAIKMLADPLMWHKWSSRAQASKTPARQEKRKVVSVSH